MSTSQDAQAKSNFHISMHQSKLKHKCLPLDTLQKMNSSAVMGRPNKVLFT